MGRIRLHGCIRCKGDVAIDRDQYGWFESCLQCGYTRDLPEVAELSRQREASHDRQRVLSSAGKRE